MTTAPDLREFAGKRIDARLNPEQAAAATAAALAADHKASKPVVEAPPDTHVTLERGIWRDAAFHRDAEVRELNGADEEALARAGTNWNKLLDTLLVRGVRTIGRESVTPKVVDELILGDREALVLAIRRVSFGDTISYRKVVCPGCAELIDVTYPLDQVPTVHLSDPEQIEFPVRLRHGLTAVLRLPTGADQNAVLGRSELTGAQQNTEMIARCLLRLEGPDGEQAGSAQVARDLPMADRATVIEHLRVTQPGPRFSEISFAHETCGEEVPLPVSLADLFR